MLNNYDEYVSPFEKIDSKQAFELVHREGEAIIYIGKRVCPFCQKFVKKLNAVAEETKVHIYYVDSADSSDMEGIMDFRGEYNIPTVPGFIYKNGDTVNVRCDSSMTEEEIRAFMNR